MCDSTCRGSCAAAVAPKDLQELVTALTRLYSDDANPPDVDAVRKLMESYKSNRNDWKKFAFFSKHAYTRNLVDEGNGRFNLILLCWGEGQGSAIHSHHDAHCFMKILQGELREQHFAWPDTGAQASMTVVQQFTHSRDQVAYIHDKIGLHRVENPSHSEGAVSLHLYSPPFLECQTFDQRTGHTDTATMTFWSKFGKLTPLATGQEVQPPEDN